MLILGLKNSNKLQLQLKINKFLKLKLKFTQIKVLKKT